METGNPNLATHSDTPTQPPVLGRVAAGDSQAVQECIDRYGGLIWSLARRMLSDASQAEDAVQEIFIDLWKSAPRFDPDKASEKTFVAMIARRRLIDRMRRESRQPTVTSLEDAAEVGVDDDRRIELSAEASVAARVLNELRPEQRRVIKLAIYDGLSHSDIVEVTKIPLGTVKSHIRRGLASIREKIRASTAQGEGQA